MKLIGKILKIIGVLTILSLVISLAIAIFFPSKQEPKHPNISEMYPKVNLNIRKAPGSNYEILKTVKPNTKILTSDSISNGFKMILNADSTKFGWASERYLQEKPLSESQLAGLAQKTITQPTNETITQPTNETIIQPTNETSEYSLGYKLAVAETGNYYSESDLKVKRSNKNQ